MAILLRVILMPLCCEERQDERRMPPRRGAYWHLPRSMMGRRGPRRRRLAG